MRGPGVGAGAPQVDLGLGVAVATRDLRAKVDVVGGVEVKGFRDDEERGWEEVDVPRREVGLGFVEVGGGAARALGTLGRRGARRAGRGKMRSEEGEGGRRFAIEGERVSKYWEGRREGWGRTHAGGK